MRLHVAVAIGVEDAEFERVHADGVGELVHLAFQREVERGDAEAAHRRRRRPVGEDAINVGVDVRDGVRPRNMSRAFHHRVARQPGIRAAVEIGPHLPRHDAAVAHDAVLDVDALGAARRAELHLLVTAETVADRRAGERAARMQSGSVRVSTLPPKPPPTVPPMKWSWFDCIALILAEASSEKNRAWVEV